MRLIGHLKAQPELEFIHRMAQDRSSPVRQEVACTLGQIHDPESLPILLGMMSAAGTRWEVGFELIRWGDDAVPGIVKLIELSTKEGLGESDRVRGEDMIRAYLQHWDQVPQPIPADVVRSVKQALAAKNLPNGGIRTDYHKEFLKKIAEVPETPPPVEQPSLPDVRWEGLAALEHSTVESLLLSPEQVRTAGLENLKKCKTLKHIQVNGRFHALEEIEQWQQAIPGVDWGFIDL